MINIHLYGENIKTLEEYLNIPKIKALKDIQFFHLNTIEECKALVEKLKTEVNIINIITMSPVFIKYMIVKEPEFLDKNIVFYLDGELITGTNDEIWDLVLDTVSKTFYDLFIDEQLMIAPYKPVTIIKDK